MVTLASRLLVTKTISNFITDVLTTINMQAKNDDKQSFTFFTVYNFV